MEMAVHIPDSAQPDMVREGDIQRKGVIQDTRELPEVCIGVHVSVHREGNGSIDHLHTAAVLLVIRQQVDGFRAQDRDGIQGQRNGAGRGQVDAGKMIFLSNQGDFGRLIIVCVDGRICPVLFQPAAADIRRDAGEERAAAAPFRPL